MNLTILSITRGDAHAVPFLRELAGLGVRLRCDVVLAVDGAKAMERLAADRRLNPCALKLVSSSGYVESVLDQALTFCSGDYVLRVDDDESVSPALEAWFAEGGFEAADNWKFPRLHLWDAERVPGVRASRGVLMTPHLFPDYQTRLSVRAKAGGRRGVHAGSPHGGGEIAPAALRHHKFVVKSRAERERIARTYDDYCEGYGTGNMLPFSLPEIAYAGEEVRIAAPGDGTVPWVPSWQMDIRMGEAVSA